MAPLNREHPIKMTRPDRRRYWILAATAAVLILGVFWPSWRGSKQNWDKAIEGAWSGRNGKDRVRMVFNSDKSCEILMRNEETGDSQLWTGRYIFVTQTKPMSLTIRNIPELEHPLNTIVEFMNSETMKVAYFSPIKKTRPLDFVPAASIVLKRE